MTSATSLLITDRQGYTVNAVLTIDSCLAGCQAIAGCTYTWLYQGDGSATDLPRCWYNRLDAASGAYEDDITGNIRMYKGKCAALNLVGDKCKDISAAAPSGQVTLQDMYDVTTTVAVTGGPITLADPHLQTTSSGSSASSASSAVSEVSAATGAVTKRARRRAH